MFIGTILAATLTLAGQPADSLHAVVPIPARCEATMNALPLVHRTMVANVGMVGGALTFDQWKREALKLRCVK